MKGKIYFPTNGFSPTFSIIAKVHENDNMLFIKI
jgi:hypothetical protein